MNLGRRGLLKLMSVAPVAAAATQAAGYAVVGMDGAVNPPLGYPSATNGPRVFTSFLSFLKDNEESWRRQAKDVRIIEADIAMMRLPLTTKVRMQQERNFERIKESSRSWFEARLLRDGEVREW